METSLADLIKLNQIVTKQSDSIIVNIVLSTENLKIIQNCHADDLIEDIKTSDGEIININQLDNYYSQLLLLEFVTSELNKIGFYIELNDFISINRFNTPDFFYIYEMYHSNHSEILNDTFEKYKTLTNLISKLKSKAKFISEEDIKTLFIVQENSFLELPINNLVYEEFFNNGVSILIDEYIENIDSYTEKRIIFLKELIDFLSEIKGIDKMEYLLSNFEIFHGRCKTSYEYYLSNFSFNKVKLELDNSVLEHSKNIRSIINESQSKLIAIPGAFVLAASQIDFKDVFCLRNILVLISCFLFSYIISIFIKNQKNALEIVNDNVDNYKINYKYSKATIFESEKELSTLTELITQSYKKTENELKRQKKSLEILQFCNWGISIALLIILTLMKSLSEIKQTWNMLVFIYKY
jgi:hypothetical protein